MGAYRDRLIRSERPFVRNADEDERVGCAKAILVSPLWGSAEMSEARFRSVG